jgi:hypothetical protein
MLNMPQMIMEWKQVCCVGVGEGCLSMWANRLIEGTWSGLEEVAEWEGEEIGDEGQCVEDILETCAQESIEKATAPMHGFRSDLHLRMELGHALSRLCSIPRDYVYCTYDTCGIDSSYDRMVFGYPG